MTMKSEVYKRQQRFRNRFLALCQVTTPHGYESYCWPFLPHGWFLDGQDNVHVVVPRADGSDPVVMFSSHLDTADYSPENVYLDIESEPGVVKTDGKTILGADCKIGVALMCEMIEAEVPGWYVFHVGEEQGMIGSSWLSKHQKEWEITPNYCVAFDRRGYDSVVTHQMGDRCCSEEFAEALCAALHEPGVIEMEPDSTGVYTDSASYIEQIPECTNISVGYHGQHTHGEEQNLDWACILLEKLLTVDWEALPCKRVPEEIQEDYYPDPFGTRVGWSYHKETSERDKDMVNRYGWIECDDCKHEQFIPMIEDFSFCECCGFPLDVNEATLI